MTDGRGKVIVEIRQDSLCRAVLPYLSEASVRPGQSAAALARARSTASKRTVEV